jgi:hypothetical protein
MGVSAHLHDDTAGWDILELTVVSILGYGNVTFFDHFTFLIRDDNYLKLISKVDSNESCAIINHGRYLLFAPLNALIFGSINYKMEPVFEELAFSYQSSSKLLACFLNRSDEDVYSL